MAIYNYSKYKIRIDSDSQKTQGLQVGDVVRRQYAERNQSIYSLMVVVETGVDAIDGKESPYFIGALLDGDEPKSGELLDFVRITSLTNNDRSGAMYLTASDSDAPYMDIIDGMATERSLCYPTMAGGTVDIPDKAKYAVYGDATAEYRSENNEANRIVRITGSGSYGIKQTLEESVAHPERLLVSFKARASQNAEDIPMVRRLMPKTPSRYPPNGNINYGCSRLSIPSNTAAASRSTLPMPGNGARWQILMSSGSHLSQSLQMQQRLVLVRCRAL